MLDFENGSHRRALRVWSAGSRIKTLSTFTQYLCLGLLWMQNNETGLSGAGELVPNLCRVVAAK